MIKGAVVYYKQFQETIENPSPLWCLVHGIYLALTGENLEKYPLFDDLLLELATSNYGMHRTKKVSNYLQKRFPVTFCK